MPVVRRPRHAGRHRLSVLRNAPGARGLSLVFRQAVPRHEVLRPLRRGGGSGRSRAPPVSPVSRVPGAPGSGAGRLGHPGRVHAVWWPVGGLAIVPAHLRGDRGADRGSEGDGGHPGGRRRDRTTGAVLAVSGVPAAHAPAELRPGLRGDHRHLPRSRRLVQPGRAEADRGVHPGRGNGPRAGAGPDRDARGAGAAAAGGARRTEASSLRRGAAAERPGPATSRSCPRCGG